jgi:hypothetical protein
MARESFVENAQSNSIVANLFISIGMMLAAAFLMLGFYWAYKTDLAWFVVILSVLMFAYSINITAYIAVIRSKLSATAFRYYIGVSIIAAFVNLIIAIVFMLRAMRRSGGGGREHAQAQPAAYMPEM